MSRTVKDRVLSAVARDRAAGRTRTAAEIAKRLGVHPGSVRRILSQAAGATKRPHKAAAIAPRGVDLDQDELRERIAALLAGRARATPLTTELLRSFLLEEMPRGPHTAEKIAAELQEHYRAPVASEHVRPVDIAAALNADASSVRHALVSLRDEGRLEYDPSRSIAAGRWRYLSRSGGYEGEDLLAVVPESRREQDRIGLRKYHDPRSGEWWIVAFDPDKHYGGGKGKRGRRPKQIAKVGRGRRLAMSPVGADEWIPVLSTDLGEIGVVDVDGPVTLDASDPSVMGIGWTERGAHLYVDRPVGGDPLFRSVSIGRGAWHERLFNRDGTARPPPEFVGGWSEEVAEHRRAFLEAQRLWAAGRVEP